MPPKPAISPSVPPTKKKKKTKKTNNEIFVLVEEKEEEEEEEEEEEGFIVVIFLCSRVCVVRVCVCVRARVCCAWSSRFCFAERIKIDSLGFYFLTVHSVTLDLKPKHHLVFSRLGEHGLHFFLSRLHSEATTRGTLKFSSSSVATAADATVPTA